MCETSTDPAEQNRDVVGDLVGYRELRVVVAVKVADRDRPGSASDGDVGRLSGKAGTIAAEQHRHSPEGAGYRQVGILIAVEVAYRHRGGEAADREVGGLAGEAAAGTAKEHRNSVGQLVGDRQVGIAIAVESPTATDAGPSPVATLADGPKVTVVTACAGDASSAASRVPANRTARRIHRT